MRGKGKGVKMNRREAYEAGLKYYNTGHPCKRGHSADRYVGNGGCVDCLRFSRKRPEGTDIYSFVENNSKSVKIYVPKDSFELIKMMVDCYISIKFPGVKVDGVNPFPFKRAKFISKNIYRISVTVPLEYVNLIEDLADTLAPGFRELEPVGFNIQAVGQIR